jgi:dTDP-4-amino-4,6-dideoxygalactose transaminase
MSGTEQQFINEAFEQNWIAPLGPNVDAFEHELGLEIGSNYVAALSSGTSAIHLALILLGVGPGDYVIGSSFTFSATINPIVYQGAVPILVDSEMETWNMDPDLLEKAIRSTICRSNSDSNHNSDSKFLKKDDSPKKPKAIIVTHLYGMPAKMNEIMAIAGKYNIPVIEDAAESLGSRYMGKPVGSTGKFGILSFNGNKIITTSGGGALMSDDESLIRKARFLATQARDPAPHYQHSEIGYNYRMSNIVAGIGRGQLKALNLRVNQRRSINEWYREVLKEKPGIYFHTEPTSDFFSNYWLTCIIIDIEESKTNRENLRLAFEAENIEARPLWKPMHLQPVFSEARMIVNGTSEKLFEQGLCLPSGSNLTNDDKKRILQVLQKSL